MTDCLTHEIIPCVTKKEMTDCLTHEIIPCVTKKEMTDLYIYEIVPYVTKDEKRLSLLEQSYIVIKNSQIDIDIYNYMFDENKKPYEDDILSDSFIQTRSTNVNLELKSNSDSFPLLTLKKSDILINNINAIILNNFILEPKTSCKIYSSQTSNILIQFNAHNIIYLRYCSTRIITDICVSISFCNFKYLIISMKQHCIKVTTLFTNNAI